jgi:hypothetical protein
MVAFSVLIRQRQILAILLFFHKKVDFAFLLTAWTTHERSSESSKTVDTLVVNES